MEYKDYYKILGVSRDVSKPDLKKAYKKLARKYHPDVSKETNAEEKFKEVGEAYEALKDPEKRAQYDRFGSNYQNGQSFSPPPGWGQQRRQRPGASASNGDFSSFFDSMFGDSGGDDNFYAAGEDVSSKITVTLEEAFSGATKPIRRPSGSRQKGTLNVKIPAGITAGKKIRLSGQGKDGMGGKPGDLYIEVAIAPHSHYKVEGKDIYLDLPIAPWEAALGAKITVPTLAGKISLKIPANAKSGQKMRLKGRGLPSKEAGDQFVVLQIMVPSADTDTAKKLYQQMAEELHFNPREILENTL